MQFTFPETETKTNHFLIPEGFYNAIIEEVEQKQTKRGAVMFQCTYKITDKIVDGAEKTYKATITHFIVFPCNSDDNETASFMIKRIAEFLKIIGEPYRGKVEINTNNWINKEIAIKVRHQQYNDQMQHAVHYVLNRDYALKLTEQGYGLDDLNDEEIPF